MFGISLLKYSDSEPSGEKKVPLGREDEERSETKRTIKANLQPNSLLSLGFG